MEPEHAASTRSIGIVHVEREQEGVREQRHVQAVGGEIAQVDLIDHFVVKEEIEQQVEHEHKRAAVSGGSGEVGARLNNVAVGKLNIDKARNHDGYLVYDMRNQYGVPIPVHDVKELGAVNGVRVFNVVAGAVVERLEVGRFQGALLEGVERHHHKGRAIGVQ